MRKFFSTLSMILAVSAVFAQSTGMGKSDPNAKRLLDAVSAKFKSYRSVQSKFSLKIENSAGKSLGNKTGSVYMKGNRYRISITGQEIFSDGSNVWTLDKAENEVTISKLDGSASAITPQKLFTDFYDKDFLYKLNGVTNGLQEVELTPIDKTKPFFKVLLYVNKVSQTIITTKVFEKAGNRYTYSISGMNTKTTVPDATFVFDAKKYPGVEVNDIR